MVLTDRLLKQTAKFMRFRIAVFISVSNGATIIP